MFPSLKRDSSAGTSIVALFLTLRMGKIKFYYTLHHCMGVSL